MIYRVTLIVNPIKVYLMCCFTVQAVLLFSLLAALRSFFLFFFFECAWVSFTFMLPCSIIFFIGLSLSLASWTLWYFLNPLLGFICKTLHDTSRLFHCALHVFLHKPPTNTQSTAAMKVFTECPTPPYVHAHIHTDTQTAFFCVCVWSTP